MLLISNPSKVTDSADRTFEFAMFEAVLKFLLFVGSRSNKYNHSSIAPLVVCGAKLECYGRLFNSIITP